MQLTSLRRWLVRFDPRLVLWSGTTLAIALTVGAAIAAAALWRDMVAESEGQVQRLVRVLAQHAARAIAPVDGALSGADGALEQAGFGRASLPPARIHELLRPYASGGSQLLRIVALDEDARLVGASDSMQVPPDVRYEGPWFERLRRAGDQSLVIGAPQRSLISGELVVPLARPLFDPQAQRFRGAVVATLDVDDFEGFYGDLELGAGWQLTLLRDDGVRLAGRGAGTLWSAAADAAEALRKARAGTDPKEVILWRPATDTGVPVALRPVHNLPVVAAVAMDVTNIMTPWRRRATAIAGVTLPTALGVLLLAWLGARALRGARGLDRRLEIASSRYRALVETSPDGIILARGGRIEYANPALARLAGARPEQLMQRPVAQLLREEPGARAAAGDAAVEQQLWPLNGAPPIEVETMIAAAGSAGDDAVQIVVRDVSGRKGYERRLRDSEERYRLMVDGVPDCAFVLIHDSGIVEHVSTARTRQPLGRRDELIGQPFEALFTAEDAAGGEPARLLRQAKAEHSVEREGWHRRTDGSRFWGRLILSLLADEAGRPRGFHAIIRDISARKHLQDQLAASARKLEELALATEAAREREKVRIARELHDELGQALTVLQMDLELLQVELDAVPGRTAERLAAMRRHIDVMLQVTRRIASDLRPLVLDDLGLVAALEWLAAETRRRSGIACALQVTGDASTLRDEIGTALFRIAQECLTNVMRHARARNVSIELAIGAERTVLRVGDDGRGLDAARTEGGSRRGLGLLGIEERARLLGGDARISARAEGGTQVEVQLPVRSALQAAVAETSR